MIQLRKFCLPALLVFLIACQQGTGKTSAASSSADTCDGPDAPIACCFTNTPPQVNQRVIIAGNKEPGERLVIKGRILKTDGTPHAGLLMYVYHTDNKGLYSKKGNEKGFQKWHGYLHGWCRTDENGRYEIHSIRPARYPGNTAPAHIHAAIKEPNGKMYYISDFVFGDDELVNDAYMRQIAGLPGGTGIVAVQKQGNTWTGERDIVLK